MVSFGTNILKVTFHWYDKRDHKHTGKFAIGGKVTLLLYYTMPKSLSAHMSILTSYETVIIAKIVILKARILNDLDRQPSKFRNLEKNNSSNEKLRKI